MLLVRWWSGIALYAAGAGREGAVPSAHAGRTRRKRRQGARHHQLSSGKPDLQGHFLTLQGGRVTKRQDVPDHGTAYVDPA
jgi:hypothetical protein